MAYISKTTDIKYYKIAPYIYIDGYEKQSMNIKPADFKRKLNKISEIEKSLILNSYKPITRIQKKAFLSAKFVSLFLIRSAYDNEEKREVLKEWDDIYKKRIKSMTRVPFSVKLIWSKLYRFFVR